MAGTPAQSANVLVNARMSIGPSSGQSSSFYTTSAKFGRPDETSGQQDLDRYLDLGIDPEHNSLGISK